MDSLYKVVQLILCLIFPTLARFLADFSRMLVKKDWRILAGDWRSGVALLLADARDFRISPILYHSTKINLKVLLLIAKVLPLIAKGLLLIEKPYNMLNYLN